MKGPQLLPQHTHLACNITEATQDSHLIDPVSISRRRFLLPRGVILVGCFLARRIVVLGSTPLCVACTCSCLRAWIRLWLWLSLEFSPVREYS